MRSAIADRVELDRAEASTSLAWSVSFAEGSAIRTLASVSRSWRMCRLTQAPRPADRHRYCPGASGLRIGQQTPWGQVSTSAGDACPRELTGSACVQSRMIGEPDRSAEPPVDLASEWEQGVAQLTRDTVSAGCAQARQEGGASCHAAACGAPPFPSRRRPVLAPIRRRTSRSPRPSAARPPASSPGDLRRRPYSCCTAGHACRSISLSSRRHATVPRTCFTLLQPAQSGAGGEADT
jgi:hypothetical protein